MELFKFIWFTILAFLIGYYIWKIIKYSELRKVRKDAVKRSRYIILWESAEKLAPFTMDLPYHPKDMYFIWKWVDYLVFDWLSSWHLKQIIFLEIKTWKAIQNNNEKQIEKIIKMKKIKYELRTFRF